MLSLLRFLYRHAFIVYFLLLEAFSLAFLIQDNPYHRASFLNSSNFLSGRIYEAYDNVFAYLDLREENARLSSENSSLRQYTIGNYRKIFGSNIIIGDTVYNQEFLVYPARVIRNSTGRLSNYLTIDKGEMHGISTGMGVVSASGVVGIIVGTSPRFSAVMSLLNKDFKLSTRIAKNGYFGSLVWNGGDYRRATLLDIPNHINLQRGDLVETTGYSSIFPAGLPVARVQSVRRIAGSGFLEVGVEYTEDYRKLDYVHVVKYLHAMERDSLNTLFPDHD